MTEKWRYETLFGSVRLENSDEIVAMPFAPYDAQKLKDWRGRLIATAPEMYSWLKTIVNVFQKENVIKVDGIRELLGRIDDD